MSSIPPNLRYAESHEWIQDNGDGTVTIGITDHAQQSLGDVVFVELPEVGASLAKGDEFGVVESVKAASDLYAPVSGEVVEVNESLEDAPESINESPYEDAWIMKVRLEDGSDLEDLLDADAYQAIADAEE
ncbi:glycine cleavage system protein GcvH [Halomonas elongata]|uniref:Glycine cleavage system H protein n=2 Tax=Halomonas elongata TaxID=2746 RepID=E1VCQ6_HALED|nr:glycine cleavage system protein GcvH [Halomonas elongata]MBW5800794.1 glycine cleavage system protein GcvH [Halomonas elongata]MDL4861151.1 glycine cleavage system protein GcvH [Halomonas elongata]OBX36460.1 glycine cleavage system H protein [Halomonas elongata]RAW08849.1 glycine cleavage system protein GcvH [Halomonas elongata]WBF19695.1 glycine cleavage system protein GcvH [Halomonas elongata]